MGVQSTANAAALTWPRVLRWLLLMAALEIVWFFAFMWVLFGGRLSEDSSTWALRYDEAAFHNLQMGATRQHVLERLGEPLVKNTTPGESSELWYYSQSTGDSGNCSTRAVRFDSRGRLSGKIEEQGYD